MKHDFIDIIHDRLTRHEMKEPSGLWQDINEAMDNSYDAKKSLIASRNTLYKVAASIAASVLAAIAIWTTLSHDSNHELPSKENVVASHTPPETVETRESFQPLSNVNEKEHLAHNNTLPSQGIAGIKHSNKELAMPITFSEIATPSTNNEQEEKTTQKDNTSMSVAQWPTQGVHFTPYAQENNSTVLANLNSSQLPKTLWTQTDKLIKRHRSVDISLYYNGINTSSAWKTNLIDYAMGQGPQNAMPDPNIPENQEDVKVDEKEQLIPIRIGLEAWYPLGDKWRLGSGIVYTRLMHTATTTYTKHKISMQDKRETTSHYIGIPIQVSRILWSKRRFKLYAGVGGMIEFNLKSKVRDLANGQLIETRDYRDKRPQPSANAKLGLQYNLVDRLGIYIEPGASYYFDNGTDQNIYLSHPLHFDINMGLKINIGK